MFTYEVFTKKNMNEIFWLPILKLYLSEMMFFKKQHNRIFLLLVLHCKQIPTTNLKVPLFRKPGHSQSFPEMFWMILFLSMNVSVFKPKKETLGSQVRYSNICQILLEQFVLNSFPIYKKELAKIEIPRSLLIL